MTIFLIIAAILAVCAAALPVAPLLWRRAAGAPAAPWVAVALAALVLGGAAGLYAHWSNWSWAPAPSDASPQGMVGRLARRLEKQPDDVQGWILLGRSYAVLEQYPLAQRAYQRADRLAKGANIEALVGLGEALTLQNEASLLGPAGKVFEQALALDPQSGKALFYGAVAAARRDELPLARDRFKALLRLEPPDNVRGLIEQQVAGIENALAQGGAAAVAATAATAATTVKLRVSISPAMAKLAKPGAALFVLIRDPRQPGPPLAARRLEAKFPLDIQLTPADAMIAGRSFSAGQQVEVVARVANGGTPTAQSGDPVGLQSHKVGDTQPRELLIDHLTP
jgi:cytochrome c-type biogenesis protein CcmH